MSKSSIAQPRAFAIDHVFFEKLCQLRASAGPAKLSGPLPDAPKPSRQTGSFVPRMLSKSAPTPRLKDQLGANQAAATPLNAALSVDPQKAKKQPHPKKRVPPLHTQPVVVNRAFADSLTVASGLRATADRDQEQDDRHSPQYPSDDIELPLLPGDDDEEHSHSASSTSIGTPISARSRSSSPRSSPRQPSGSRSTAVSVTSSSNTSPATTPTHTPRGENDKQHSSGVKKLLRRLTRQSAELAASVGEAFKSRKSRHSPSPGRDHSPTTTSSPKVKFGAIDPVDVEIDLTDSRFEVFADKATEAAFIHTWDHDTSDVTDVNGKQKKNADRLRPTFVRDFDNSTYFFRQDDGTLLKLTDTDTFINCVNSTDDDQLAEMVSNIASQNLGNFLKNTLFLRQDNQGKSHSILRLNDGTPVMPLAIAKASYVLSKDADGTAVIDYKWESSVAINGNKPIYVKTLDASPRNLLVTGDAVLTISIRITVTPDGDISLGNPRIQASGWTTGE